jgi:hypothetical protein
MKFKQRTYQVSCTDIESFRHFVHPIIFARVNPLHYVFFQKFCLHGGIHFELQVVNPGVVFSNLQDIRRK